MVKYTLTHERLLAHLEAANYFEFFYRHQLKILPEHFRAVVANQKRAEVRFNDRNYRAAEIILLFEYDPNIKLYSGRFVVVRVTHVLKDSGYLLNGFVMLSFEPFNKLETNGFLSVRRLLAGQ